MWQCPPEMLMQVVAHQQRLHPGKLCGLSLVHGFECACGWQICCVCCGRQHCLGTVADRRTHGSVANAGPWFTHDLSKPKSSNLNNIYSGYAHCMTSTLITSRQGVRTYPGCGCLATAACSVVRVMVVIRQQQVAMVSALQGCQSGGATEGRRTEEHGQPCLLLKGPAQGSRVLQPSPPTQPHLPHAAH